MAASQLAIGGGNQLQKEREDGKTRRREPSGTSSSGYQHGPCKKYKLREVMVAHQSSFSGQYVQFTDGGPHDRYAQSGDSCMEELEWHKDWNTG